jgi:hypothetical protein
MSSSIAVDQIQDEIAAMQSQEENYYYSARRLKPNASTPFRPYMVQWMSSIHDTFQLCPVVVPTAMYYLDCLLCEPNAPLDYQLCGLTALHLATKVHETRIFQLKQLLEMGSVCFTEQDVLETEKRILKACNWRLHPPVPEAVVYVLGKLFSKTETNSSAIEQIPMLALQILRQGQQRNVQTPSVVAYASLLVAMEQSCISVEQKQALCMDVLKVTGYSADTTGLPEAYKTLATPPRCASPADTTTSQRQVYPVQAPPPPPPPVVINQAPAETMGDLSHLLSPESRDEGEYREVITCAEDGIEVTFCGKPSADVLDSISPRNVEDL